MDYEIIALTEVMAKFLMVAIFFSVGIIAFYYGVKIFSVSSVTASIDRNYFLSSPLNEIQLKLERELNKENDDTIEILINRYAEISDAFHRLYDVEKKVTRKQNFEYFDLACYHEYESIKKVMELIDRGIPITHNNVMDLLEVIIEGLESKYNEFLELSTEEVVQETKDLKRLQAKELEDSKFIQ